MVVICIKKGYDEEFVITQCACTNDRATLKKKFSTRIEKIEMDDIAKKKKKTGRDSIKRRSRRIYENQT